MTQGSKAVRGGVSNVTTTSPRVPCPLTLVWWRVVVVLVLMTTPGSWARGGSHQILWGRCYSFCIKRHLIQKDSLSGEVDPESLPKSPIRTCQRHDNCRWCLYVCERPEDNFTNSTSCLRDCRYTRTRPRSGGRQSCTEACGFVGRASSARGGACPAPQSLHGFRSACVASCHGDRDCSRAEEKCCSNDCGTVCTPPEDIHILPPVPTNISFKMLKTGGVLIKWKLGGSSIDHPPSHAPGDSSRSSSSSIGGLWWGDSPVLYILRWWCPYTSGAVTSVTDRGRTKLQGYPTGIYPGSKCHFMVAAVNLHGSRGFSTVSPYIKKFLSPSPPLHLEQVRTRVHSDDRVDVILQWQPPVYTDGLPIYKYQVFWSDHLPQASPNYMRFHMYRRMIDADKTTFVLQSLRPGTVYFVQVRAVVRWKRQLKRGELASAYIETYRPLPPYSPNTKENDGEGGGVSSVETEEDEESIIHKVTVNQTFFQDTILKASLSWTLKPDTSARKYLIYWRVETCARNDHRKVHRRLETSATSHDQQFFLYNLQPQCEYAVRVHPVKGGGRTGPATVTSFLTPPCHLTTVRQGDPPVCHTIEPPGQVKGLHSETSQCVTVIRWDPPTSSSENGDDVTDSYDVMWGQTEEGVLTSSTVIYTSAPHELSVPANVTELELGQLDSGQHYSVQVRAQSAGGSSVPALLHLKVPLPDRPCPQHHSSSSSNDDKGSPAEDNSQHANHSLISSQTRTQDAEHTNPNISSTRSPASSNETLPSDVTVTSYSTGDVSQDVVDKSKDSDEHSDDDDDGDGSKKGDGGGDNADGVDSGGGRVESGTSPVNPPRASVDWAKETVDKRFKHSETQPQQRKDSIVRNTGHSRDKTVPVGEDSVEPISPPISPTNLSNSDDSSSPNSAEEGLWSVTTNSSDVHSVAGAGVTLKPSSLFFWTLCLLCVCLYILT